METIKVRLSPIIVLTFENVIKEITNAGTLVLRDGEGNEVGLYQAGTYTIED